MTNPFADLPRNHFAAIYADPPWAFKAWAGAMKFRCCVSPAGPRSHRLTRQ
jgi:16S rRNA G966 N2-methylase RsmD